MAKRSDDSEKNLAGGLEGFVGGLTGLVEKLNELAKTGKELREMGEIHGGKDGRGLRGIYGVNVKVGLTDDDTRVEPFGNLHKDREKGYTVVPEVLEPVTDVFEEDGYTRVIAEMPGIAAEDVRCTVDGDILCIEAARGEKKYHKELLLPHSSATDKLEISCNNGILELKCFH